jgi:quercetin dioxygenase-like cupin family protein
MQLLGPTSAARAAPAQRVAPHRNAATVLLLVTGGAGVVQGADGARACRAGDVVVFDPHEVPGMLADAEELLLLAILAPRPGARVALSPRSA